jgi:AcrR family transcriptional regulator
VVDDRQPRRMTRPQRREALLEAATALVAAGGLAACTMEAVADAAGVAKTLPYAYFATRDDLLLVLFERVVGAVDEQVVAVVNEGGDLEQIVRGALDAWFDAVRSEGRLLEALLDGGAVPGLADAVRRRDRASHKLWHDVGIEHLGLRDADAHVLAAMLNHSATGVVLLWARRRGSRPDLVDSFVTAALGAAAAMGADRSRRRR